MTVPPLRPSAVPPSQEESDRIARPDAGEPPARSEHRAAPHQPIPPPALIYPLLIILAAVFLTPLLFTDGMVPDERLISYIPERTYNARWIAEGYLPLYNPHTFFGSPNLATHQYGMLYLPNRVLDGLFAPILALKLNALVHLAGAGLFFYLFLRRLLLLRPVAFLGAIMLMVSSGFVWKESHPPIHQVVCLIPALFYFAHRFLYQRDRASWVGVAVVMGFMCYAGFMQGVVLACMALGIHAAVYFAARVGFGRFATGAVLGVALAAGGALAAAQILPVLANVPDTPRAELTFEDFSNFYFPANHWPMFLFPFVYGGFHPASGFYEGKFNLGEVTPWAGVLPVLLLALGFLRRWKGERQVAFVSSLLIAGLGFILVFGGQTPFYRLMFHVPGYNMFRGPARSFVLMHFGLSVAAALGAQALWLLVSRRNVRAWALPAGLAVMVVVAGALAALLHGPGLGGLAFPVPEKFGFHRTAIWLPLGALAATLVLTALWVRTRRGIFFVLCALPLVAEQSWYKAHMHLPPAELKSIPLRIEENEVAVLLRERMEGDLDAYRIYPFRLDIGHGTWETLLPSFHLFYRVRSFSGYGPLFPRNLNIGFGLTTTGIWSNFVHCATDNRLLSLMNVRFITILPDPDYQSYRDVLNNATSGWTGEPDRPAYRLIHTSSTGILVYENTNALPRAYAVRKLISVTDTKEFEKALVRTYGELYRTDVPFDPRREAYLTRTFPKDLPEHFRPAKLATRSDGPNRIVTDIDSDGDAFVVFAENYLPDWTARIDGDRKKIYPVNGALMGVAAPAGSKQIVLEYRPKSFERGVRISLVTLAALVLLLGGVPVGRRLLEGSQRKKLSG